MNRHTLLFLLVLLFSVLHGQDAYHQQLKNQLQADYGLSGGRFVLTDNEMTNANAFWSYGTQSNTVTSVSGQDFGVLNELVTASAGANPWDAGFGQGNPTVISAGDRVLLVVWLRVAGDVTPNSAVNIYAEDVDDFTKEAFAKINLSNNWLQYLIPFESTATYGVGELNIGLHLGFAAQTVEVGGFNLIDYDGQYTLDQLPLVLHNSLYAGNEEDAPWRAEAAERIENFRKADLTVNVVDTAGYPVPGATVSIEMQQHAYGFGTAVKPAWVAGNSAHNAVYADKLLDLDGSGHGFNMLVNENSLKWRAWEQGWAGTPAETVRAIAWAKENGIVFRGHNMLWPGKPYLPDDVVQAIDNGNREYLKSRIFAHLDEKLNYPGIKDSITDWDVLNEITLNEDVANTFRGATGYSTGREIYAELINKVRSEHPEIKQYLNDFITIGAGTMNSENYTTYKSYIQELFDAGAGVDGIGFQSHIGSDPTSIYVVYDILEDFYQTYGTEAKITEYDLSELVDPEVSASYLRDFLTITFSHPSTTAFIMWGFWDGAHWKNHAPMFAQDWSLKPAGQAFIDLIFKEWWTEAELLADESGTATVNGFKGDYLIKVTYGEREVSLPYTLTDDNTISVSLEVNCAPGENCGEGTASTFDEQLMTKQWSAFPNPARDQLTIDLDQFAGQIAEIELHNGLGQLVRSRSISASAGGDRFLMSLNDVPPGAYWLRLVTANGEASPAKLLMIE